MAANTAPIFVLTPRSPGVRIATANTNTDGSSGTYGTLFTAGSNGSFFKGFRWACENSTATNGAIRMFIQDAGAGNVEMVYETIVPVTTFSAGVTARARGEWYPSAGIVLSASSVVKVSTHIGENFACYLVGGGDY